MKDQDTGNRGTRLSAPCWSQTVIMIKITKKAYSLLLRNHDKESTRLPAAPGSAP